MEERRSIVRRRADRELFELIEKKTGIKPAQLVRERKFRRAIRHTCKAVLDIEIAHAPGGSDDWTSETQQIRARVLDLSEGGAALFTQHEFSPGQRFGVGVKIYDGQTIQAQAEVRWSKPKESKGGFAIGVQFIKMDETNLRRLEHFLAELDATLGL